MCSVMFVGTRYNTIFALDRVKSHLWEIVLKITSKTMSQFKKKEFKIYQQEWGN